MRPVKDLALQSNDVIAHETKQLLVAVKFLKNRKKNFDSVVRLCQKASLFISSGDQYLVAFDRSPEGVRLAMATLEEMRIASWKVVVFAAGQVIAKQNALRNMLACAQGGPRARDKDAYCSETFDSPMAHFAKPGAFEFKLDDLGDPKPEEFEWTLPCKMLNGFISFSKSELEDPLQKIEAAAEERLVCACPHFDANRFSIREKPQKISRSKRYW